MPAIGPWFITPHAVRRYLDRVEPGLTFEQALGKLIHESRTATFVRLLPSVEGQRIELWRGKRPHRLRLYLVYNNAVGMPALMTLKKKTWPKSDS